MLQIDQYQSIEIKLNIKCEKRLDIEKTMQKNNIPCSISIYGYISPSIYRVRILVAPHNLKKFMKKIKKLIKD